MAQGSFDLRSELHAKKRFFGPPSEAFVMPFSVQKPSQKHPKLTSIGKRFRSPFSVSNTGFEGGGDGRGDGWVARERGCSGRCVPPVLRWCPRSAPGVM